MESFGGEVFAGAARCVVPEGAAGLSRCLDLCEKNGGGGVKTKRSGVPACSGVHAPKGVVPELVHRGTLEGSRVKCEPWASGVGVCRRIPGCVPSWALCRDLPRVRCQV